MRLPKCGHKGPRWSWSRLYSPRWSRGGQGGLSQVWRLTKSPHPLIARRLGPCPGGVILRLIIILDDAPPLVLGQSRQTLRLQRTASTWAPCEGKLPACVIGVALFGCGLVAPRTGQHARSGLQGELLGTEVTRRRLSAGRDVHLHPRPWGSLSVRSTSPCQPMPSIDTAAMS